MKRNLILSLVILVVAAICFQTVSAQFPIKIPKIGKPKTEQPKTEESNTEQSDADTNSSAPNEAKQTEKRFRSDHAQLRLQTRKSERRLHQRQTGRIHSQNFLQRRAGARNEIHRPAERLARAERFRQTASAE